MRLLLAGGGTAGHINPALAIADYLLKKKPDTKILYVGAKGQMEESIVKDAGYNFKDIEITGFSRKINLKSLKNNTKTIKNIIKSNSQSKKILKDFKPDICIGTGGYVSGPIIRAAQKMKIPTLIHEQNAFPGITTKMLSKNANCVMLATSDATKHLNKNCTYEITGNPIRSKIITTTKESARRHLNLDNRPVILSFGGSLGARTINEAIIELIKWSNKENSIQHIHAYGKYGDWFIRALQKDGIDAFKNKSLDIRQYINNMPTCLAAADLIICRAGAITISEIQAQGKASILIPSPNVAENHQYYNALSLNKRGAAILLEEKNLKGGVLIEEVKSIIYNNEKLTELGENAKKMAINNANEKIYKIIYKNLGDAKTVY